MVDRPLSLDEYERYGRQMIMPGFGLPGQLKLKAAKVAVVGAGGLGCPVLQYLAGAGVGTISIFDHDTVAISNLHRQILHTTERVGMNKTLSACQGIKALNPHVKTIPHTEAITPSTALSQLAGHDLLIDCTDRPLTRYLLSDVSVALDIPLVSGAAISTAGQWAVYGGTIGAASRDKGKGKRRACYRCMWPRLVEGSSGRCEEVGVWGMVTGIVGTGMASEVIKVLSGQDDQEPLLHLLHLGSNPLIRTIRMRPPSLKCHACGPNRTITVDTYDYDEFCAGAGPAETSEGDGFVNGRAGERISAKEFAGLITQEDANDLVIIDTRPEVEFGICSIPGSRNIPLQTILSDPNTVGDARDVVFLCKKGNDSQLAAAALRTKLDQSQKAVQEPRGEDTAHRDREMEVGTVRVRDVRGGLIAWAREVDPSFPLY